MPTEPLTATPVHATRGWASHWFRPATPAPKNDERALEAITRRLVTDARYALLLLKEAAKSVDDADAALAWETLDEGMALVPEGLVPLVGADGALEPKPVCAFYLDRYAVTNSQFKRFVQDGSYESLEIWPREIWPALMRFVDRTGQPGPQSWQNGTFPAALASHPVVGVCWYEALAYARWVGKRLPTAAEWQKAGGWPEHLSGGTCTRYPWGDLYAEGRANLWSSGLGGTTPVNAFRSGSTPNGIYQMSGNVWEWLDDPLETIPCQPDQTFLAWKPMRRIVGGAFDTYLPAESINQFITGQAELDRKANIGFRCALGADRLRAAPGASGIVSDRRETIHGKA
jgi:gamma-glutamyl hercynylcysteine S-oxide synthase